MFCPISMYPKYIISNEGIIYSQRGEMKQNFDSGRYKHIGLTNGKQKLFLVHRLVYQHFGKDWNPELTIDHIDGNPQNNHISNLRMATRQQQNFNKGIRKSNLGVKGVLKVGDKYCARIAIDKKRIFLGYFKTIEEASNVYQTKAKELYGEFYRG
jgi:hypothetical protein